MRKITNIMLIVSGKRMQTQRKAIPYERLAEWRANLDTCSRPLVVTNGCFDLLHPGHVFLLEKARTLGTTLLVGVTGDDGVRALKGPGRPAMPAADRLLLLSSLESVSFVCVFPEIDALHFLEKARPDIYVKGGDYTIETIHQGERLFLEKSGARIEILPRFEAQSSSAIFRRIAEAAQVQQDADGR